MKERTGSILRTAVRDFIKTGQPISSHYLFETYDFNIKPAMIRRELKVLADEGYLYQNHPSGGRAPTDKAYRFFVKEILFEPNIVSGNVFDSTELKNDIEFMVDELVDDLRLLSAGYELRAKEFYQRGLKNLMSCFDFDGREEILEVLRDVEILPERLAENQNWWSSVEDWPQVFIGKSPFTRSQQLSVIADRFDFDDGDKFLLMVIGPKRMDYQKSIKLFKKIHG